MSKILITADIHFGVANKLNDILWSLKTISEYALQKNIETVVVCGDLFHDRVNYNIEVLNAAHKFFTESTKSGINWIIFPGNHDMPYRHSWEVNALKPISNIVKIVDSISLINLYGSRFWILPFIHHEDMYMKELSKIETMYEDGDVLLTHVGVNNASLNECFLIKHWSIVAFDNSKFDRVFTGHFHCHQEVGANKNVVYPGSPIPFRFDEGMVSHGFIEYDVKTREYKFIDIFSLNLADGVRPPDYITLTDDMIADDYLKELNGNNVRIHLSKDYSQDELLKLRKKIEENGALEIKFNKLKDSTNNKNCDDSIGQKMSSYSSDEVFIKWVEHDNPSKLDKDLLLKLNRDIINS